MQDAFYAQVCVAGAFDDGALDHWTVRMARVFLKSFRSTVKPVETKFESARLKLALKKRAYKKLVAHMSKCSKTAVPCRSGVVSLNSDRPMDFP